MRELQDRYPYDPTAPSGVPAVIRSGVTEFHPEISDDLSAFMDLDDDARELVTNLDFRSAITVAMKKRGRVVGALQFIASTPSRRYTADDVALAETVAGRVASSIENLRLHEREREIARTLQRSLPPPSLPDMRGNEAVGSGGTADELAHRIQQALEALLQFESRHDDIALLVLAVLADSHPTRHLISKREDSRQLDAGIRRTPR